MYVIDTKLKEREAADEPIQCGILGAGEMTLGLVNQIERHVPGMRVAAIYNRTILKAERCYRTAGNETIVQVENAEQADSAIVERTPCIVANAGCLWKAKKIDVIVEMTGTTHEAFEWILEAMKFGKKVVSFNAELDATVGPYL
jgi:predicted homoserine dehydrogenase-like protein